MNESCYNRRAQSNSELTQFHTKSKSFSNTFLPFQIKEWTNLDAKIRNLPCRYRFKKSFLIYLKTDENSIFDVHNPIGIKLLNWLILNLSWLKEHNFRHNFRDTVNSLLVMPKLKPSVTISCFALCFPNKERNSSKVSVILKMLYQNLWW